MTHSSCFYCTKDADLEKLMMKAAKLPVSTLYLNKDQTHKGRCILAFDRHVKEIFQLSGIELQQFMQDVSTVAKVLDSTFHPGKLNYGIYGDLVSHLHVHLVPKYKDSPEWGEAFINVPNPKQFLPDEEYKNLLQIIREGIKRIEQTI
jgi:ATP adenylyltransferase